MPLYLILLILLAGSSLWAVMRGSLIRATIALAIASATLSVIMYKLLSPLAAVFELSVCAGLITVVFMSTISLAEPLTYAEAISKAKARIKRFWYLPVMLVVLLLILIPFAGNLSSPVVLPEMERNVYKVIWELRQLDVFGQILILFAGIFGVAVYFKNTRKQKEEK